MNAQPNSHDPELEGVWLSDIEDQATNQLVGSVKMGFTTDGELIYVIQEETSQIIKMIYWTDGNLLYTDQPSKPNVEVTRYLVEGNNLVLDYNGDITKFKRQRD